jgi:hypothetical protein
VDVGIPFTLRVPVPLQSFAEIVVQFRCEPRPQVVRRSNPDRVWRERMCVLPLALLRPNELATTLFTLVEPLQFDIYEKLESRVSI